MAQIDKFIQFTVPDPGGRIRIRATSITSVREGKVLAERRGYLPQREITLGMADGSAVQVTGESLESVWRLLKGASDGNAPQVFVHDPNDLQRRNTRPLEHPDIDAVVPSSPAPTPPAAEPTPAPAPTHLQTGKPPLRS